jgi:hypothetical protein
MYTRTLSQRRQRSIAIGCERRIAFFLVLLVPVIWTVSGAIRWYGGGFLLVGHTRTYYVLCFRSAKYPHDGHRTSGNRTTHHNIIYGVLIYCRLVALATGRSETRTSVFS